MNTEGGSNITLTGSDFGIGEDYTIEIREGPGGTDSNFPVRIEYPTKSIHHFTHESLEFVVPEGQNTRDDPMELVLKVAGQVSDPMCRPPVPAKCGQISTRRAWLRRAAAPSAGRPARSCYSDATPPTIDGSAIAPSTGKNCG